MFTLPHRLCVRSVWRFAVRLERNRWNQGRIYYGHAIRSNQSYRVLQKQWDEWDAGADNNLIRQWGSCC